MEIGAIGSGKTKKSPFKTQKVTNFNQDNISIEHEYKEISNAGNYPILNGEIVGGNGYITYVKQGFVNTYQWILNNKKEYLNKVTELFSNTECRVIYKSTNDYSQLISTSYHPDLLKNKVDRTIYFHRIGILIKDYENFNEKKLYQTEIESMLNGDIPSFKINANSKNATNYKNELIYNSYRKSILETIKNKIQKLNPIDLERQISLIYLSYIGCKMEINLPNKTKTKFLNNKNDLNFNYLNKACSIGNKVIKRSFSITVNTKKENSWLCYIGFGNNYYSINPVGWDLYKGNSGIALFFMYLGKSSKEKKYIQFAKDTLNSVNRFMNAKDNNDIEKIGLGAFTGMYSYVYTLYKFIEFNVYTKFEINRAWNSIYKILDLTNRTIKSSEKLDVIGGISGIMGVLVTIYESSNDNFKNLIKEILFKIINFLKDKCIYISSDEVSWTDNEDIGYAHGNSGIICHLARSYKILQNKEILHLIHKALKYERNKQFNKKNNMWVLRKNAHYYSWCNGIAGLLLTKIVLLQNNIHDEKLIDELKLLITQLKNYGFGNDYSICHGDIGSISILKYAAKFTNDNQLKNQCTSTLNNFIHNYLEKQNNYLYTLEDWGIMTGKTGIGMGLLDESNDKNVVSDLLLLN
jgi:type 2 lantibiotic biosynthesis protein LanM